MLAARSLVKEACVDFVECREGPWKGKGKYYPLGRGSRKERCAL